MSAFPLIQFLFYIAVFFCPKTDHRIVITQPDHTQLVWVQTADGWAFANGDHHKAIWKIDGDKVVKSDGTTELKSELINFKPQLSKKSTAFQIDEHTSLHKEGAAWIYVQKFGDRAENHYKIEFFEK